MEEASDKIPPKFEVKRNFMKYSDRERDLWRYVSWNPFSSPESLASEDIKQYKF